MCTLCSERKQRSPYKVQVATSTSFSKPYKHSTSVNYSCAVTTMSRLRVAVIGGGAAGLCAAKHLAARPDRFEPVVFEKAEQVGGTWVYTEDTGRDKHGLPIHSSMYSSLKTNLPKEVMAFPDFPFEATLPSFLTHADMLAYLEQYAHHFDLLKYIQFSTLVNSVRPVQPADETKPVTWEVKVQDLCNKDASPKTLYFDAVMVCNGHHTLPKIPKVEGIESFPGEVLHSHTYRHPTLFKDKSVLVVGAAASGVDIALDLSKHAKQIHISHWQPRMVTALPPNVGELQAIKSIDKNQITLTDDVCVTVDTILFCTGYEYDFSFLHPDCGVNIHDSRVTPLYKHAINWKFPSLSFIGVTFHICPFPQFQAQVQLFLAALDGSMKLPTREEMEADEERDYRARLARGFPHRYAHYMGVRQWDYANELAKMAGVEMPKPVVGTLYEDVGTKRRKDVLNYKKMNYRLLDDLTYEQLPSIDQ